MPLLHVAACAELINALTEIAARASQAILQVAGNAEVHNKGDGSPVTAADEASEAVYLRRPEATGAGGSDHFGGAGVP